jgi:hypothetical protein
MGTVWETGVVFPVCMAAKIASGFETCGKEYVRVPSVIFRALEKKPPEREAEPIPPPYAPVPWPG